MCRRGGAGSGCRTAAGCAAARPRRRSPTDASCSPAGRRTRARSRRSSSTTRATGVVVLPDMPVPRHGLGVVAQGRRVFTVQGGPQPGFHFSNAIEALTVLSAPTRGYRPAGKHNRHVSGGTMSDRLTLALAALMLALGAADRVGQKRRPARDVVQPALRQRHAAELVAGAPARDARSCCSASGRTSSARRRACTGSCATSATTCRRTTTASGSGRDGGSRGEAMQIFYDAKRLDPQEYDHYWLSDTPNVIGSKTWGGCCPRMVTWIRFLDRRTEPAVLPRQHALRGLRRRPPARTPRSSCSQRHHRAFDPGAARDRHRRLQRGRQARPDRLRRARHQRPVRGLLGDRRSSAARCSRTFHGYQPLTPTATGSTGSSPRPASPRSEASINTFSRNGQFPSDHLPVQAVSTL